jgi:hypothetical protein
MTFVQTKPFRKQNIFIRVDSCSFAVKKTLVYRADSILKIRRQFFDHPPEWSGHRQH